MLTSLAVKPLAANWIATLPLTGGGDVSLLRPVILSSKAIEFRGSHARIRDGMGVQIQTTHGSIEIGSRADAWRRWAMLAIDHIDPLVGE